MMSDIQSTKERLENWKRCYRNSRHYACTRSLEGRYKAPPTWHPPDPSIFIDTLDAAIIEKALVNPTFPKKSRNIIKYSYMQSYINIDVACRKMRLNKRTFDDDLETAIRMLHNRLNKHNI